MATRQAHEVFKVPAEKRQVLLRQRDDVWIQDEDTDFWVRPSRDEDSFLEDYLNNKYHGAPKRFWTVRAGTRVGYNDEGVFIIENHQKRYFGLEQGTASASLKHAIVEEACPKVNAKGERLVEGTKTDQILGKMLHHLPTITDDMRYKVLHASFQRADRNGNGKLSRPELGIVLRRIINTLRTVDIEEILKEADDDGDGQINYKEFVSWLKEGANAGKVAKALGISLGNEADIVRATFRLWDTNGDGMIPNAQLFRALVKVYPDMTKDQVRALVKTMDCDHDNNVDYDEFVDFLFHRAEGGHFHF